MWSNKVEYSTYAGLYCTAHDVKVPFCMSESSSRNIIYQHFHVDSDKTESGIGYVMIIGRDLMVQLGLSSNFKLKVLKWDGEPVPVKELSDLLGKSDLTSCEMCEVVIQTAEPYSTREATDILVEILDSTYAKADLEQVANNETHLNV